MKKPTSSHPMIKSRLSHFHLKGRRVLVRIDGNVPLANNNISDDYRLRQVIPTLNFIKERGGISVIVTHLGRPKKPLETLSTKILQPWFIHQGFSVAFAPDIKSAYTMSVEKKSDLILLENIRFFPEEQEGSPEFSKQLAHLGDYYVNDAFATLHRADTSITFVPYEFPSTHRTIGFLVEKELAGLTTICDNPPRPFVIILGGGKPETKIPVINSLLEKADTIFVYPALSFTFLKAQGKEVGTSLLHDAYSTQAQEIMNKKNATKLIFPTDYLVMDNSHTGSITVADEHKFPHNAFGVSIGPKTLALAEKIIQKAGSIFFNCAMGFPDQPNTLQNSYALLQAIASSCAYSVIAGGNSVELAFLSGTEKKFNVLSTGGGATLDYLAGKKLPGLEPFLC